jgi:acyl-CoA synthetase (AMP-forming)/AMP-acid ligase II
MRGCTPLDFGAQQLDLSKWLRAGYLNNEELNAKVFRPHPANGERIYNTGDLAKRVSGALYCLGRKDLQIKLRGFRIEVEEIASILKRHPLVGDCCVDLLCALFLACPCLPPPPTFKSPGQRGVVLGICLIFCVCTVHLQHAAGRLVHLLHLKCSVCCSKAPADSEGPHDQMLVAWIVFRSPSEIKRIVSGSDISSLTDNRFASLCKSSFVRINSVIDESASQVKMSKNLSADLEARSHFSLFLPSAMCRARFHVQSAQERAEGWCRLLDRSWCLQLLLACCC